MQTRNLLPLLLSLSVLLSPDVFAQAAVQLHDRLSREILDVEPPSQRVSGEPGEMRIVDRSCRVLPLDQTRRRMVDIAVQEWAFFGMTVQDLTKASEDDLDRRRYSREAWRALQPGPEEAARIASSIAGYWAAAPDSSWILERQNQNWRERGSGARWRDFWSAAFISWVACEGGLGDPDSFERAIAHHTYIDQAIRARDGEDAGAAFVAYDVGEAPINPGDLLCRGSRPEYLNLEQRREQMGLGARSHCDLVVNVDMEAGQIRTIGGNVRGSVRMKIFPAKMYGENLGPVPYAGREIFAHLKLRAKPIEAKALLNSPMMVKLEEQQADLPLILSLAR